MEVKSIYTHTHDEIDTVCIAIARENLDKDQQHIGFLYKNAYKEPTFLHLAWHHLLTSEAPRDLYLWLDIPIDVLNTVHLITFLEMLAKQNLSKGIPYGIAIDGTDFDRDGTFKAEKYAGLTCATFIVQVLHSQGYEIIDFGTWEKRLDDKKWQVEILKFLERHASKEHVAYQKGKIAEGAIRFRPEEVAVAANGSVKDSVSIR